MDVTPGIYQHYKGDRYVMLFTAAHHETRQVMVVYVSLHHGTINVRPLYGTSGDPDGWNDPVTVDGEQVARFKLLHEWLG